MIFEFQEYGPLRQGARVRVEGIADVDDHYGLIATCRHRETAHQLPLADLEARRKDVVNHQPLRDYCLWFANR